MSARRYVVQRHSVAPGDEHYDLMIEDGAVLVTFQLEQAPSAPSRGRRSFDHRPRYLEYEGPISGGRGSVRIWDRGALRDLEGTPRDPRYLASFAGERLRGRYLLEAADEAVRFARADA